MRRISNPEVQVIAPAELMQRGCVYVISLAQIQSEIGVRWEATRGAVWSHLDNLLRDGLAPTDIFSRLDDTAVLISMPSATASAAQICCLRIAHELHTIMLGPCDLEKLAIERCVAEPGQPISAVPVDLSQVDKLALRAAMAMPRGVARAGKQEKNASGQAQKINFVHRFVPIWDVQKEAITTYRCETVVDADTLERLAASPPFKLDLAIAIACIRNAAQLLTERLATGERFLAWIPVSYELLSSPVSRIEISALCRSLSATLRPYLIFEIGDLPHGVPQSRLSELVAGLRPFCRNVVAQLPPCIANYGAYPAVGLHAIGLSFGAGRGGDMQSEVLKLGVAARRQHVLSFALDIPSEDLLLSARERGVTLLSSPLIGKGRDKPGPVRRLTVDGIGRQAASQTAAA